MHIIEDKPALWPYILLSLLLHALMVVLLPRAIAPLRLAEKSIEIIPVAESPEANQSVRIADIAEPKVQERPKKAKFLGMYDSTVSQEAVSTTKRPGKSGEAGVHRPSERERTAAERPRKPRGDRLLAFDSSLFADKKVQAIDRQRDGSRGERGSLDDFYPDFRRGAHTYLNVLRYPDIEYFVRLKRAFKIAFNPEPALREHFSMNQIARGSIDVVLGVSVDRSGNLAELFVFRSSSIPTYDNEALRTVRASAPFSTPPAKFTEGDGLLRMSWTFSVYL
jgi:TonB family protein